MPSRQPNKKVLKFRALMQKLIFDDLDPNMTCKWAREIMEEATGEPVKHGKLMSNMKAMGVTIRGVKSPARTAVITGILQSREGIVPAQEVHELLLEAGFKVELPVVYIQVAKIRKQLKIASGRASSKWESEQLQAKVKIAVAALTTDGAEITYQDIIAHLAEHQNTKCSKYLARKHLAIAQAAEKK